MQASNTLNLRGLLLWCGIALFLATYLVFAPLIPLDYTTAFDPAARAMLNGQPPYSVDGVFNPPYLFVLLTPLTLLPPAVGGRVIVALAFVVFVAYTGMDKIKLVLVLTWPPVMIALMTGNIDFVMLIAIYAPSVVAIPILALKPQVGLGALLYLAAKRRLVGFWVLGLLVAGSVVIYGPWFLNADDATGYTWNVSPWLFSQVGSICIGLLLWLVAWRAQRIEIAIASSIFCAPFVGSQSYIALLPLAVASRYSLFALWLFAYAIVALKLIT